MYIIAGKSEIFSIAPVCSLEIAAYLRGETLAAPIGDTGWVLVAASGFPLGLGKASAGQLKKPLP
jgi:NOL1/NOP2/fmu family ribosome biogenesis protein